MLRQNNLDDMSFYELAQAARMNISEYLPQWSDINTHDPGVMLIELFAWLTEQQRFYMDRSEEAYPFFPLFGITLKNARAAQTQIEIPGGFAQRVISAKTPLFAEDIRFETTEDIFYDGSPVKICVIQRETVKTPIVLGTAQGYPGESFATDIKGQIILDFALSVSGGKWTMTEDFRTSKPEDKHYTLNRETGDVTFGDGIHGELPYGEVTVTQMSLTRGPDGNIAQERISALDGLPVTQPNAAEGGFARETVAQALRRIETERERAATAEDIERLVLKTPGLNALRVRAYTENTVYALGKPRVINIAVKLKNGELTDLEKRKIRARLEPYRLVCRDFVISQAKTVRVKINLEIQTGPHGARFKDGLETAVRTFFEEKYKTFGAVLRVSELRSFVLNVPEVSDVTHCAFRVYGGAKMSRDGDVTMNPDTIAELSEITVRITK